jgi:hypothetical protein
MTGHRVGVKMPGSNPGNKPQETSLFTSVDLGIPKSQIHFEHLSPLKGLLSERNILSSNALLLFCVFIKPVGRRNILKN